MKPESTFQRNFGWILKVNVIFNGLDSRVGTNNYIRLYYYYYILNQFMHCDVESAFLYVYAYLLSAEWTKQVS